MIGLVEILVVAAIVLLIFVFSRRRPTSSQNRPPATGGGWAGTAQRGALETKLAHFTLGALVLFAPLETWASWSMAGGAHGLLSPYNIIDVVGMALMLLGSLHSLRARPHPAPGVMCAAHGWMAANGWRATLGRVDALAEGDPLRFGSPELWVVAGATALALACFALSLTLTARAEWAQ